MLTDVGAVLVIVVPVAMMVIGAGVIVVMLSTVANEGQLFVNLYRIEPGREPTEGCLNDRGSCKAGRHRNPVSSVGICRGYSSAIRSAFSELDRVASLNLHNFGDIASDSGTTGRSCGRACCGNSG